MKRIIFTLAALVATAGSALAWSGAGTTSGTTSLGGNTMRGVDTRLENVAITVSGEATRVGEATFTQEFATRFGVTTTELTQQQTQFGISWGDLFVTYAVQSAARTSVTLDEIVALRTSGLTWSQVATSLSIPVGRLLLTVRSDLQAVTTRTSPRTIRDRTRPHGFGSESGNRSGERSTAIGFNRQVDTRLQSMDDQLSRLDDATIASRLAQDFEVTTTVLIQQRTQFQADWGDLLAAYTLVNASRTTVTLDQIFALRASGATWIEVARTLRIPVGVFLRGLRSETQTLVMTSATSGTTTTASHTGSTRTRTGSTATSSGSTTTRTGSTTACTSSTTRTGSRTNASTKGGSASLSSRHSTQTTSQLTRGANGRLHASAMNRGVALHGGAMTSARAFSSQAALLRAATRVSMMHGRK